MPGFAVIQFTQDQMRALTGVSSETVRHWRKTIPYLATKTGKAARFSFADLVGLAVTHELVNSLGVHIGTISGGVDTLFRLLEESAAPVLEGGIAIITPTAASVCDSGSWGIDPSASPTLAIPLNPLISRLQQHVLPVAPSPSQTSLPFPPEAVRSRA
ncbi:MerR family transcriptional regulator [Roseateles puraquae]|uniref:HTH merR-type domain-containing protein n=1 Tax=Roseateles puraquae TaxID=431059 RepID=A0A254N5W3_9BURK|nr:hypothetical protein [Roseateles puraquae]OWR02964.1 hypothetical protein CDO81_15380 [Roseateles puraquae]